jgi:hypothetical protein
MFSPKRLAATLAAAGIVAAAGPAAASAAPSPFPPGLPSTSNICLQGFNDPGPFGPSGPYGAMGPYGPDGPLHGTPNPLGDVANCGGLFTFFLRGGTVSSFVQANLQSVGR